MKNFINLLLICLFAEIPMLALTSSAPLALLSGITVFCCIAALFGVSLIPKKFLPEKLNTAALLFTAAVIITVAQIVAGALGFKSDELVYMPLCCVSALLLFYRATRAQTVTTRGIYCAVYGVLFTAVTFVTGAVREVLGSGSFFGNAFIKNPFYVLAVPAGAVLLVAVLTAVLSLLAQEVSLDA